MNLETRAWDEGLLAAFSIPRGVLPRIAASSEVYGEVSAGALRGVPVAGILGDQQAALVGQTCFRPGYAKNTYGTGCFVLMNVGTQRLASTAVSAAADRPFAPCIAVASPRAGRSVQRVSVRA